MTRLTIMRAGPLATIQDSGRFGMLGHGISASGPMDRTAFHAAGRALGLASGGGIEFTQSLSFAVHGAVRASFAGGAFNIKLNRADMAWPAVLDLGSDDRLDITPGADGNFGYVRFSRELDVPVVLGSQSTNVTVGLGGWKGRPLRDGDSIAFRDEARTVSPASIATDEGPIRVVWGLHAQLFDPAVRARLAEAVFVVSRNHDRMGVRLTDPSGLLRPSERLSLVSDPIVPGDIQILGDGTPVVLMRDHQPTGGYPRLATIASADLDRFAQMRPGTEVQFQPVTLDRLQP